MTKPFTAATLFSGGVFVSGHNGGKGCEAIAVRHPSTTKNTDGAIQAPSVPDRNRSCQSVRGTLGKAPRTYAAPCSAYSSPAHSCGTEVYGLSPELSHPDMPRIVWADTHIDFLDVPTLKIWDGNSSSSDGKFSRRVGFWREKTLPTFLYWLAGTYTNNAQLAQTYPVEALDRTLLHKNCSSCQSLTLSLSFLRDGLFLDKRWNKISWERRSSSFGTPSYITGMTLFSYIIVSRLPAYCLSKRGI